MKTTPSYGSTRNTRTNVFAWICAVMILVMLVCQLFGYEDFPSSLDVLLPINNQPLVHMLAALIVIAELLALPYILGMYISKAVRIVSASLALLVSSFWLITSLTNAHAANSALFSTTVTLPGGIIAAAWSLVLFGFLLAVIVADTKFRHATNS